MSLIPGQGDKASAAHQSSRLPARRSDSALGSIGWGLCIAAIILWAGITTDIDSDRLAESGVRMGQFLARMFPPDFSVMPEVIKGTAETLRIAILGTIGCIVLSAFFGLLAAETVTPPWVHRPIKFFLALVRSIPMILVAMLMVGAMGLGPLPGIFAIALHATGMLGKFYAEGIENVNREPVDALSSAGASLIQRLRFAVWPQMAPVFIRDTLFRFELNLRESLVLGIVGAGGIGFYIQTYVRSFQYQKAATLTLIVVLMVLVVELVNTVLRRRFYS